MIASSRVLCCVLLGGSLLAPVAFAQTATPANPYAQPTAAPADAMTIPSAAKTLSLNPGTPTGANPLASPQPTTSVPAQPVQTRQPAAPATAQPVNPYAAAAQSVPQNTSPTTQEPAPVLPAYGYNASPSKPPQASPEKLPPLPSDFDLSVQKSFPLTPEQIQTLHKELKARQRAASNLVHPPKSVTSTVSVSLAPGSQPAVIRPYYGMSTSLVITDSTGAPWPVQNFAVGDGRLFSVQRLDGPSGSTFVISALQMYGTSNLILKLAGNPTPVVIDLVAGQKVVDARVEARVAALGPNARVQTASLAPGVDTRLLSVLDGVPPQGRPLVIKGDDQSKAWLMPNGRVWLRTRLRVISPAPISFASSSDSTTVYELPATARILGMAGNRFVTIDLKGCMTECANP